MEGALTLALGLVGTVAGAAGFYPRFTGNVPWARWLMALFIGLGSALAARVAWRDLFRIRGHIVTRTIVTCGIFGAVVPVLSFLAFSVLDGHAAISPSAALVTAFVVFSISGMLGTPFGVMYGVAYATLLGLCFSVRGGISPDDRGRALRVTGIWLFACGAAMSAISVGIDGVSWRLVGTLGLSLVGLAVTAFTLALERRRVRWIAAVRRGHVPGWRIRAEVHEDEAAALPAWRKARIPWDGERAEREILAFEPAEGMAYRSADDLPALSIPKGSS